MTTSLRILALLGLPLTVLALCGCTDPPAVDAKAAPTETLDAEHFGPRSQFLFWTPEQQVAGYRNIDQIFDTRIIHAGGEPYPLVSSPRDFSAVTYEVDGTSYGLDDYVSDKRVAGLLVVKDDEILLERYSLGNDENSRWVSFSIAKSAVSILIGAAIEDGYIESVNEPVTKYLPLLAGGGYDGVSIRDVLQMASGVTWNEDYADPASDVNNMPAGNLALLRNMAPRGREAPPGDRFNYNTAESNLAGALLRAAIGNNLSTYLTHKLWQPFGMESDATWMLHEPGGGELGGCCISATLRDYARIGIFAMQGGVLADGTRVLPEGWMAESTEPSARASAATATSGSCATAETTPASASSDSSSGSIRSQRSLSSPTAPGQRR